MPENLRDLEARVESLESSVDDLSEIKDSIQMLREAAQLLEWLVGEVIERAGVEVTDEMNDALDRLDQVVHLVS